MKELTYGQKDRINRPELDREMDKWRDEEIGWLKTKLNQQVKPHNLYLVCAER